MSTATSVLEQRLGEQIGDHLEVDTTTNIAASATIISTALRTYDAGRDDFFNNWFVYITEGNNAAVQRTVSDYASSSGTLTIIGSNLTAETAAVTIRLHRYDRNKYIESFADAARELYPVLFKRIDNVTLVTGSLLPNGHFEDWASTAVPDKWAVSNAAASAITTAGLTRGGSKSVKVTASAAGGYLYLDSNTYPRLLDLMGRQVSVRAWAYPEVANDASIVIYTLQAAGSAQTLASTTTCPAGAWTLLELKGQSLNDDLVRLQIRLRVATNAKYVYFDNCRIRGHNPTEYLLPTAFVTGKLHQVYIQDEGRASYACDDLMPRSWEPIYGWQITDDGTDKWLQLPALYGDEYLLRLIGITPLEVVSAYTDTIALDGERVNLFIAYAEYKFWQKLKPPVASMDIGRYQAMEAAAYQRYLMLLPRLRMSLPSGQLKIPTY